MAGLILARFVAPDAEPSPVGRAEGRWLELSYTKADLNVDAVLFILATAARIDLSGHPNVAEWHARCASRPARTPAWS